MTPIVAEFLGTCILILFGVGVVANSSLKHTIAENSGNWVLITFGWGFGVYLGVIVAGPVSGAHINPAVSVGLAVAGKFPWSEVPGYVAAQLFGAIVGSFLAWVTYYSHYKATEDPATKLGTFSTGPAIKNIPLNFFSEVIGTFFLVFVVLHIAGASIEADNLANPKIGLGSIGALPVAFLVVAIGMSLGGTTGYAINPARDLGPRIVHALVPMKKGSSNWSYAWIPVFGPLTGAALAGLLYLVLQ